MFWEASFPSNSSRTPVPAFTSQETFLAGTQREPQIKRDSVRISRVILRVSKDTVSETVFLVVLI